MRVHHFAIAAALSLAALASTAPGALAQRAEAMKYCKADVARLCPGVPMGGGRIIACLKEHKDGDQRRLRQGAAGDERQDGRLRVGALSRRCSEPLAHHRFALRPQSLRAFGSSA